MSRFLAVLLLRVALVLPTTVSAQLIGMKVCASSDCAVSCTSWTTQSGSCAVCDTSRGPCSWFNPSSITTMHGITFYADATCTINTTTAEPVVVDGQCHALGDITGYSYSASNVSAVIGGIVGSILALIVIIVVVIFVCRARGVACCACCCGVPAPGKQATGCCYCGWQTRSSGVMEPVAVTQVYVVGNH